MRRLLGQKLTGLVSLAVALTLAGGAVLFRPAGSVSAAQTFYVSRNGSNGDGLSWGTAWSELSRINWTAVQAGDTILVDGGSVACPALGPGYDCGMVYNSTLTVAKSGSSGAPITIRLAPDAGRNGTVIIDGGITAWSKCAEYPSEPTPPSTPNGAGVRETGINLGSSQWVVLDGTKWGGIEVRNHTRYGLNLSGSQRVTARYLKIHHNTDPVDTTNNAVGITQNWQSQYNTVSRVEIFRNGQDALRGAGDFFTLEESYLHDTYCNHPDGIQSFVPTNNSDVPDDAGEVRGLIIRRNVFDKIGMQNVFLGENATHNSWNIDVTVHDNLFLNSDYVIKSKHGASRNWRIYNNTVVNARNFAVEWCCASPGAQAPMAISDNIFVNVKPGNTAFYLPTGGGNTTFSGNCLYSTGGRVGNISESGTITADPLFTNSSLGNYALASSSPCVGKGASVTSVTQLLSLNGASAPSPTTESATATPSATRVPPTATDVPPATATHTSVPGSTATTTPPATATALPPATVTTAPPEGTSLLTFAPAADAYVDASSANSSFGGNAIVRTVADPEQRSYLRFNVSGVAGRTLTQALLRIYANGSSPSGFVVQKVVDNQWTESSLTFANRPLTSGSIGSSGAHNHGIWLTVDVTSYITGDGTYSLALLTTSTKPVGYPSREADANPPQLVLQVTDAPAALNQRVFIPLVAGSAP